MKERLQGIVIGVMLCTVFTGAAAIAKTAVENIEVSYDNIKVYKDNVLCELKDANGTVIEPFIYNGTTYMPVRGTASLADMQVTWDGNTKSVYLWDEMVPEGTYLMEVCPPYSSHEMKEYVSGNYFNMAGENYSNGFIFKHTKEAVAYINLNGRYNSMELILGMVSEDYLYDDSFIVSFIVDNKTVATYEMNRNVMPRKISVPLNYGNQLKICTSENLDMKVGFGDIILK